MYYNTKSTEWPCSISSPALKSLIGRFFNILDSTDVDAGDRLADEIFTQDARLKLGGKWLVGSDGITVYIYFC